MTNRRSFLGLLAATPFVAPVVVKEMAAPKFGGGLAIGEWMSPAEIREAMRFVDLTDYANRLEIGFGNTTSTAKWTQIHDGEPIDWQVPLHIPTRETPNRLYGAYIKDDGDAA